jgi:hypothetical protein
MTISEEVEHLRMRIEQLEAELAAEPPAPEHMPLGAAETLLQALRTCPTQPKRPVRVSVELFEALQEYAANRLTFQVADRSFVIVRDVSAPRLEVAVSEAVAE